MDTSVALPPPGRSNASWDMFVSPIATLNALRERPRMIGPMLLAAVWATAVSFYVIHKVGLRTLVEASIRAQASVDPDALIAAAMQSRKQILIMQGAGAFFGTVLTVLALALLYWLLVTVAGGDTTYHAVSAVVAHVLFFTTFVKQTMIALVVTLSRNPASFNFQQPIGTNLAYFVDSDSRAVTTLMTSFDVLAIAGLVLTVFGLRAVSERLSTFAASAVVLLPWGIYVAVRAYMAALA